VHIPGYEHNNARPPLSPAVGFSRSRRIEDTARYLLTPDDDFQRPYLAVPGRSEAFVWPLGIEGFELSMETQMGIHRYLGGGDLEVSITHQDETHIMLSGIFPGWTSVENMNALRRIYNMTTPASGKILHLPGILPRLQFVVGENCRFSHAEEDRTQDLAYQVSFIRVGLGRTVGLGEPVPTSQPSEPSGSASRGSSSRIFVTTVTYNTLRKIAMKLFGNVSRWSDVYAKNASYFDALDIPAFKVPNYILPVGLSIYY
jgi:hypothetical protein